MAEVRLSAAARVDLRNIRRYSLDRFGGAVADRYLRGFTQALALLADRPLVGMSQPKLGPDVRRLTQESHRIFYRLDGETVRVMRILHHAQRVGPLMLDS